MSAIFGIYNNNKSPINNNELIGMQTTLNHWNADKVNSWSEGYIGLGHLMLFNTPESLFEIQPLVNSTYKVSITAAARIDNRAELHKMLFSERKSQNNYSDSELILELYLKYKEACVKYLIGDFAFAIWDEREQQLFCARDHMGIQPFFYYKDNDFFAFASEKKGLLALDRLNKATNEEFIYQIVSSIDTKPEETVYKHIYRLPGAHTLVIKNNRIYINRYWDLDSNKVTRFRTSNEYVEAFREKFTEAINCRLHTAYSAGCELSGGLDSSGITCIAADLLHKQGKKISTYSYVLSKDINPEGVAANSEEHFAEEVCAFAGVDEIYKIHSSGYENFLEEIDLSLFIGDGPDNAAQTWNWPIKQAAGKHNTKVLLSGFPGDELVTNYCSLQFLEFTKTKDLLTYFRKSRGEVGLKRALKMLMLGKLSTPLKILFKERLLNNSIKGSRNSKYNYLTDEYFDKVKHNIDIQQFWPNNYREIQKKLICDPVRSYRMESEMHTSLMNKMSTRFPMADIRLLEFVLSVPVTEKASPEADRWLYRRSMQNIMPQSIVDRKDKTNAVVPFVELEWVARQDDVKNWLSTLKQKNKLSFFNYDKFINPYNWHVNNTNYDDWVQPSKNKQTEGVLRWLENNT